jgi:hypothetical protein
MTVLDKGRKPRRPFASPHRVLLVVALLAAVVVVPAAVAKGRDGGVKRGTAKADRIIGTPGNDRLVGRAGNDYIDGRAGNDTIDGGAGSDMIIAGTGSDRVNGGDGNDSINARDGTADLVSCGAGRDTLTADASDRATGCETRTTGTTGSGGGTGGGTGGGSGGGDGGGGGSGGSSGGGTVVLTDSAWTCSGPVNLDLVKVTIRTASTDAIFLRTNCSGRIGRIEVETWTGDGLKVNAPDPVAHDLVIEGGYIRCYGQTLGHQDGIQAMGGQRITFRNLEINCNSNPNAQLFLAASNGGHPTDIVCDGCTLGGGAGQSLFITTSTRSGARNSTICEGRFQAIRIDPPATSPVNQGNRVIPSSDPRCRAPAA